MGTLIALVVVMAMATVSTSMVPTVPRVRRAAAWAARGLARCGQALCLAAAFLTDLLVGSDRNGRLLWERFSLWFGVALVPMALCFAIAAVDRSPSGIADPGWLLLLGSVFPILVVGAAAAMVFEDYDVMDGVIAEDRRRFRGSRMAARGPIVTGSLALFAAYAAAIAWWLAGLRGAQLTTSHPQTGLAILDYVVIGLRALPTNPLLSLLDRLTGDDTQVVFAGSPVAVAYHLVAQVAGMALLVAVVAIAVQQTWQAGRIVTQIRAGDVRDEPALVERLRRAPAAVRHAILRPRSSPERPRFRSERSWRRRRRASSRCRLCSARLLMGSLPAFRRSGLIAASRCSATAPGNLPTRTARRCLLLARRSSVAARWRSSRSSGCSG